MSNVIIGTAGHVDHGKTMLIKALTGTDTDRLKEEKARGITIELGFAYLTLPDGRRCGIIDVPGHEKFVRNMLAGAGSIDISLFVVAADEGIMPQSREHLEILTLLNISRGVIAVTKADLAEQDWLDMVIMDIRDEVKGTFLENAPIIPVSAKTGAGIDTLKNCLFDMILTDNGKQQQAEQPNNDSTALEQKKAEKSLQSEKSIQTGQTESEKEQAYQQTFKIAQSETEQTKTKQAPESGSALQAEKLISKKSIQAGKTESGQTYDSKEYPKTGQSLQTKNDSTKTDNGTQENSNLSAPFRLPIDRVFTIEGFGTVVTGTLTEGRLTAGGEVMLYPSMQRAKARSLQVHSLSVPVAERGQRVAVNLAGIKNEDIHKGCVLAEPNSMQNSDLLDVRLDIVKSTKRKITNNSRLHLYHGTNDVTCRLTLLECDSLTAGESGYAQLRTESPVSAKAGDRFVVRFYSPMETVGGGVILDPNPAKRTRGEAINEIFRVKEKGDLTQRLACFILDRSRKFPLIKDLKLNPFYNNAGFDGALKALSDKKEVFIIKDSVIHKDYLAALTEKCRAILKEYHIKNPLSDGMNKEELRSKLLPKAAQQSAEGVLEILRGSKVINIDGNTVSDGNFKIVMTESQRRISDEITKTFLDAGFAPPVPDELAEKYAKEQRTFRQAMERLISKGELIMLTPQIVMHVDFYNKALTTLYADFSGKEFSLGEYRDTIQSSRKYAVALLEYFDSKGITKKQGDVRIVNKNSC